MTQTCSKRYVFQDEADLRVLGREAIFISTASCGSYIRGKVSCFTVSSVRDFIKVPGQPSGRRIRKERKEEVNFSKRKSP